MSLPLNLKARQIGDYVSWNPSVSLDNPETFTPVFEGTAERLYQIEIRTNTQCLTVDTQLVKITKNVEVYVPTAFTPNNDSRNDFLHPILRGIKEVAYFRVFNRLGQLVYDGKDEQHGWDGTFRGVQEQTQAVVWIFRGVGVDGIVYTKKGTSVLVR
jgi:gliding motility-associated-like protein